MRTAPAAPTLSADDTRRLASLLAAADARRADTAAVRDGLSSGTRYVRQMAALTAGQVHMRAALPALRALLEDRDTAVAATAAYALGLARDSAGVGLLQAAVGGAPTVAAEAAWSLGEIGEYSRGAIATLLGNGKRAAHPPAVTAALLLAASKLRPTPVDVLMPYLAPPAGATLADDERTVLRAATYAIARPRAAAGARAVLAVAGTPDAEVRANVARSLVRPAVADSLADRASGVLARLARDEDPHVRINALRSLATWGERARAVVVDAAHDADANVRIAAAQSAGGVLDSAATAWAPLWAADTGFMFRRSLLASAEQAGSTLPARAEWAAARDWRLRASVAEAAGSARGWARVSGLAAPLLRDPDPRVREMAAASLDPFADSAAAPAARQALRELLRDPDFYVRATALGALGRKAAAAEVPEVLSSWRLAAGDSGNDARIGAVRYLAAAWRADSTAFPDSLRAALRGLAAPADPLERAEAANVSLFSRWPGIEGTPRPLAWYEDVVRTVIAPTLAGRPLTSDIVTERGTITLELFGADAPLTVQNFVSLARGGFYRETRFHRVVPNFVAQDGDPRGDGNGGPGWAIRDELNRRRYDRGAVGMALSGPDTGGSQYFITHSPQPHLDGHYTVFGHVVSGWSALDQLVQGDRILSVSIR